MFGIRFIKVQPTTYLLQYRKGQLKRQGQGLALFYFAPTTSLVAVPLESVDVPFIFNQVSADFQEISIQGQVTYRVIDAKQLSQLLNFTLDNTGRNYISTAPEKLPQRIINLIQVLMQSELAHLSLRETLGAAENLVQKVLNGLATSKEISSLGLEILGLSILSIKPNPETARALEADVREQLLKESDQAIYARRNAAVEQERAIKENELQTEIAVENKKRQVREAQMEAERSVKEKERQISEEEMTGKISLEKRNKEWVALATENLKSEADAKAYSLTVTMQALSGVDAKVLQALASMDMNPSQLVALAFRDIADNAEKIGQLNVSSELLTELLQPSK
ncbi:MAG TPA: SPFH domain-containing protein [Thiotrichaceae bacterium]|nr:SPFH domain-containing protein [Thiotrichaceae bacterium]